MTRRILITLGSTTDAERCGDCTYERGGACSVFNQFTDFGADDEPRRLPECIAAEKAAESAARIAAAVEAETHAGCTLAGKP